MRLWEIFNNLDESFDTTANIKWKNAGGDDLEGEFYLPNYDNIPVRYLICIYQYHEEYLDISYAEIHFMSMNLKTREMVSYKVDNNTNSNKVFSIIVNGTKSMLLKYDVDAIVFGAVDNADKRMSLYNRMFEKMFDEVRRNYSRIVKNIQVGGGELKTALINNNVTSDKIDDVINLIKRKHGHR